MWRGPHSGGPHRAAPAPHNRAGAKICYDTAMNTSDEIELTLDGIAQGGAAVGRVDGMAIFAHGGIPGERVRARLTSHHQRYAHAEVVEVLEPSPDRVPPRVPASDHAAWQHIAYPAQLRYKETIVREQLAKLAGLHDPPLAPIIGAPQPWGYRNSARLHLEGGAIGYHAAGANRVRDLPHDPLLLPVLNLALAGLRAVGGERPGDLIAGLTLRASAAYGYALAQIQPQPGADPQALQDLVEAWRAAAPALAGVVIDAPGAPAVGADTLHEAFGGVVFSLSPGSFFQVNIAQAERMLDLARAELALTPEQRLLDGYSGAGAFALPLAPEAAEVVAVEEHPGAVADGRRSAELNEIGNVQFVRLPVERALGKLVGRFDAAILDPPRRGCHPEVLAGLAAMRPARIAYISCHPGILARDLGPLLGAGYTIRLVQPVDLFPQTPHIEAVVILEG